MNISNAGSVNKTGDGVVGTSGEPIRVFAAHVISGASAGSLVLRNGTSASGTIYVQVAGSANTGVTAEFGTYGILFPDGCFYDHNANNTAAVIAYSE